MNQAPKNKPTQVKILNLTYEIRWVKKTEAAERYGWCSSQDLILGVCEEYAPHHQAETVLHEINHAL